MNTGKTLTRNIVEYATAPQVMSSTRTESEVGIRWWASFLVRVFGLHEEMESLWKISYTRRTLSDICQFATNLFECSSSQLLSPQWLSLKYSNRKASWPMFPKVAKKRKVREMTLHSAIRLVFFFFFKCQVMKWARQAHRNQKRKRACKQSGVE